MFLYKPHLLLCYHLYEVHVHTDGVHTANDFKLPTQLSEISTEVQIFKMIAVR